MSWVTASSTWYALHGHHSSGLVTITQQDIHLGAVDKFQLSMLKSLTKNNFFSNRHAFSVFHYPH